MQSTVAPGAETGLPLMRLQAKTVGVEVQRLVLPSGPQERGDLSLGIIFAVDAVALRIKQREHAAGVWQADGAQLRAAQHDGAAGRDAATQRQFVAGAV